MKAHFGRIGAVGLLLSAGLLVVPGKALAVTQFGSTPCGGSPRNCVSLSWSGNGTQTVCAPTSGNLAVELDWVMVNSYTLANTDTEWSRSCSDARVTVSYVFNASATLRAWVECPTWSNTWAGDPVRQCQNQQLFFNTNVVDVNTGDPNFLAALACHEYAHTVGLQHNITIPGEGVKTGCVQTPSLAGVWSLASSDRTALRNTYA